MVEGYLIGARNFFSKWDNKNNYQIYIPEIAKVLGYFKNKKMDFSEEKFYKSPESEEFENLEEKIRKGKFIKKVEIEELSLNNFISSKNNLDVAQKYFEDQSQNLKINLKI